MMKKLFNKWGGSEEGKGKKTGGRSSEGLVRGPDVPILVKSGPQLLTAGPGENGGLEKEPPDAPPARPVPSFIANSVNLPSYGQATAVPLPLPSEAIALPLPEPSQSSHAFPSSQGNPQSLPTEDSVSPGGFGFPNQGLTMLAPEGDPTTTSEAGKGVSNNTGLTISRTGGNKSSYSGTRGLSSVFRSGPKAGKAGRGEAGVRSNQNPLPFNFPNQRPSPLETVLSGPKRGQVPRLVMDATTSEPAVSPQLPPDLSTPSPNMTPRSAPDWTSAMPPVSPFWNRNSPGGSPSPLPPKLRRSPSLNSNPDSSSVDPSNTSSPLSRFSPVAQANQNANQVPGKPGKSAPSSPAHSESLAVGKSDAFGSGNSISSAMSEPPLSPGSAELNNNQAEASEAIRSPCGGADDAKQLESGEIVHGRHLLGLEPWEESGRDDTSEASSMGGSESTESSAAGNWLNSSSPRTDQGATPPPRVHFDLNAPQAVPGGAGTGVQGLLLSPRGKAAANEGLGDALPLVGVPEPHDPPRFPEGGYKKEVGEEDLTRSVTPRTAEALQGEAGRRKGSQAGSPAPLGVRSPQKPVVGAGNRVQRPLSTHLNVPKQLTPITAGPAWHESIAGLPVSSSEAASSAPQAHPLPDIGQAYTPPSIANTPSPKEGTSLPPAPLSHAPRGVARVAQSRTLSSPEPHPHHSRASSDGRLKSNENCGSGKPLQAGGMLDSGPRSRPHHRNQSEPIPRGISDAPFYPRADVHPLPLSEATRTLSDPIMPRAQKRTSLDQDATPLPLPLPPAEDRGVVSKGVSPSQAPSSPALPSPLPGLPSTGYALTPSILPLGKPAGSMSPSIASTRSLSPHASPISVLQRGDRNSREFRGVSADQVAPGPKLPVNWRKGEKLGSGTFGSVYRGLNSDTGEMFAVKEVGDAQQNVRDESTSQLEHEVALLSRLKHPNIVQYVGTKREDGKLYIFLEFMPGGTIESNLRAYGRFTEPLIRAYTKQILCGLKYLHDQSTIHRDIKGANILVDINGRVKLADFGMAKQTCETNSLAGKSGIKGSPFWMAPEVVKHEQRKDGRPADIWSVGCTVLEMAEGVPPWSRDCTNPIQIIWKIASSNDYPHIPEHLSQTAVDFIKVCLNRSPDERPKVHDLLNHPFIADVVPDTPPDLSVAFPRVSPPGTPSPRPAPPVVPRTLNRTTQSPAAQRLSRQKSGKQLEERIVEDEESVSATVAALVDAPSPRASGGAVKQVVGAVKLRPKTPPPNWSPNGSIADEPKPGTVKSRFGEVSGSVRGGEQNEARTKPSLRWKSPTSRESAVPPVESSFRFAEVAGEEHPRAPLTRHKSADAPTLRRPFGTLLEDDQVEPERLQKVLSVPLEATKSRSGPLDKFGASNLPLSLDHKRYIQGEVG